jgi:lactate permease
MWPQNYEPIAGSPGTSAACAAIPIAVLLFMLGVLRKPAWMAGLSGLLAALLTAIVIYGMPVSMALSATAFGAAFGMWPIGWILLWAVYLYRLTLETGRFEMIKDAVGGLTPDRRLQALLIAFAFGAFIEGAAGFGAPVAVAAAMLSGLGFSPFYAAGICLLANTAPVAFGSIGIPVITLAGITGLPLDELSAWVGSICAPVSFFVPAYLVLVMGGWRALVGVWPAVLLCGASFAGVQFYVSNYVSAALVDIASSLSAIVSLVVLFRFWKPKDTFTLPGDNEAPRNNTVRDEKDSSTWLAWMPWLLLVVFVFIWGEEDFKKSMNTTNIIIDWPGLHNQIQQAPPVVKEPTLYAAKYTWNWLSAAGTACMLAALASLPLLGVGPRMALRIFGGTLNQLRLPLLTIGSVLGLAFLMNYSGATGTLGLAFAATGAAFPFFSAMLGWLGVFLTGSDTSANALFGNLQVITANKLGLDPVLMAAANSSGGVMGKMISLQSIAVAAAASGMKSGEEARLFRMTVKHSIFLAAVIGAVTFFYSATYN